MYLLISLGVLIIPAYSLFQGNKILKTVLILGYLEGVISNLCVGKESRDLIMVSKAISLFIHSYGTNIASLPVL